MILRLGVVAVISIKQIPVQLKREWNSSSNPTSTSAWSSHLNSFFSKTSYLSWQTGPLPTPPSWSLIKKNWSLESRVFSGAVWRWHVLCGGFHPRIWWSSNSEGRGISFTSSCVVWSALSYCAPALFLGQMKGIHFSRCLLWLQLCLVVWGVVPEQL